MAASSSDPHVPENSGLDDGLNLMRLAQAGDATAFSLLYVQHSQSVTAFLRKRGGASSSLEAMAQEVFFRAWRCREQFNGYATAKTYLLAIARNVWSETKAARSRATDDVGKFERVLPQRCPFCAEDCRLAEPEAAICRQERRGLLARHIVALPRASREAIEAVLLKGLSPRQAAVQAGCSEKAYSKRVERAVALLRVSLGGGGNAS